PNRATTGIRYTNCGMVWNTSRTGRSSRSARGPAPARGAYGDEERPAAEPVLQHVVIRRGPPRLTLAA
ncbi:hypothetical protein ABZ951_16245, partial [Streptomyces sp. NPDC046215]